MKAKDGLTSEEVTGLRQLLQSSPYWNPTTLAEPLNRLELEAARALIRYFGAPDELPRRPELDVGVTHLMYLAVDACRAALPEARAWLECDHCGDVAIEGDKNNCFTDGTGGACISCSFPGQVSCDSETDPYWMSSDADEDRCNRPDCEDCKALQPAAPAPSQATEADHTNQGGSDGGHRVGGRDEGDRSGANADGDAAGVAEASGGSGAAHPVGRGVDRGIEGAAVRDQQATGGARLVTAAPKAPEPPEPACINGRGCRATTHLPGCQGQLHPDHKVKPPAGEGE